MSTLLIAPSPAWSQFQGSITPGITHSSNIEGVDTSAPDNILQPVISLEYQTEFSPIALYKFDFNAAPYLYATASDHSYLSTIIGVSAQFYLTQINEIRSEAIVAGLGNETHTDGAGDALSSTPEDLLPERASNPKPTVARETPEMQIGKSPTMRSADETDSLVECVTTALYAVSAALDSIEYQGKAAHKIETVRDSASEIISTLADLLDSVDFSVSVKEVVLDELKDVRQALTAAIHGMKQEQRLVQQFEQAVTLLSSAEPQSDFLPTSDLGTPVPGDKAGSRIAGQPNTPQRNSSDSTNQSSQKQPAPEITSPTGPLTRSQGTVSLPVEDMSTKAPVYSLITSTTSFRDLGSQDFDIGENLDDASAMTYASKLMFPFQYEIRSNQPLYRFYNYTALTAEATLESYLSHGAVFDLSYDLISTNYPTDSVASNLENKFRLLLRGLISRSTTLFGEATLGFKNYSNPLVIMDSLPKLKKLVNVQTASAFQQYGLGIGLSQQIGEDAVIGATFNFTTTPSLRAYLDQSPSLRVRKQSTGITDDEYTYNLIRFMAFTNLRTFGWLDIGVDLAVENRTYGSLLKKDNAAITKATGADRTEKGVFGNLYLSHTYTFDEARAIGIFNSIILQATISSDGVRASVPTGAALPLYSYDVTEVGFNVSLGF